jgi:hypothetical protein
MSYYDCSTSSIVFELIKLEVVVSKTINYSLENEPLLSPPIVVYNKPDVISSYE